MIPPVPGMSWCGGAQSTVPSMCRHPYLYGPSRQLNAEGVERRCLTAGQAQARDFSHGWLTPCISFGEPAWFVKKYLKKGTPVVVHGRIQTGGYTNRDGVKIHTIEVVAEDHDFAGRKNAGASKTAPPREEISSVHGSSTDAAAQSPGREGSGCSDTYGVPYRSTDLPEDEDDVLPFS